MSTPSSTASDPRSVLRWYTAIRRMPRMIGKAPGGGNFPGGPYTLTAAVSCLVTFTVLSLTEGIWGTGSWVFEKAVTVGLSLAVLFGCNLLKTGSRNPLELLAGLLTASTSPRYGTHLGATIRRPRPVAMVRGRINVYGDLQPAGSQASTADPDADPTPAAPAPQQAQPLAAPEVQGRAPGEAVAMSAIQRQLAQLTEGEPR